LARTARREAEIPEQTAKRFVRNWSEKPGFRRFAPEMRPKEKNAAFHAFIPAAGAAETPFTAGNQEFSMFFPEVYY
jgi:hypothetical protein